MPLFSVRRLVVATALLGPAVDVVGQTVGTPTAPTATSRPSTDATPAQPANLEGFVQEIASTDVRFELVPIPGGVFMMGSPESEQGRAADEGPQRKVRIDPFWMGKCEVTWDEYEQWMFDLERQRRPEGERSPADVVADAVTRPTPPYTDMTFGMGKSGYPAICMTQRAAKTYCEWLSAKTGRRYRLPTEAEWEYACRAATTTAYSFGDDPARLGEFGWYGKNSDDQYQKVGTKRPNAWGLHDMHGNVAEWVLDQLASYRVTQAVDGVLHAPIVEPTELYPRVVRGGSWEDPASACRSAARAGSEEDWKMQDPQIPQSVWYHTDATFVGFRVVCVP